MLDEITADRLKDFPSESDSNNLPPIVKDYKRQLEDRGQVSVFRSPDNPEDWKSLETKAMKVLEDGMDSEVFKDRKSAADTVFEIQGKKGNKRSDLIGNTGIIISEEVAKTLAEGLTHFAQLAERDVTNESFKISPRGKA